MRNSLVQNKNFKLFLSEAITRVISNGVSVKFFNADSVVSHGSTCSGYFDHKRGVIGIAAKDEDIWPEVFIHEYCHFLQWSGTGKRFFEIDYDIDEWLNGKINISDKKAKEIMQLALRCEINCEKKVVRIVKKYHLPISIPNYIKKANWYLLSYRVSFDKRKWSKNIRDCSNLMPNKWLSNYWDIPKKYYNMVEIAGFRRKE